MEILKEGLVTLGIGMGTVFAVLIMLFLILKLMGYVSVRLSDRGAHPAVVPVADEPVSEPEQDDGCELAAVISAAISAYCASESGVNPSRLRIRSIRRATKWDGSR